MHVSAKVKSLLYSTVLLAFLTVSIFALPMMATMGHHEMGGTMSNCPFMVGETALCAMNVLDHIASWQAMFTALPTELSTILLLLLSLVLTWVWLRHLFDPPDTSQQQSPFSYSRETYALSFSQLLLGSAISPRAP